MWIGLLIVLVIILIAVYIQKPEYIPFIEQQPQLSASENAAKTLAAAEAPKSLTVPAAGIGAGSPSGTLPAAALITVTTQADVAKTQTVSSPIVPTQTVPTQTVPTPIVPSPIVPATPVTSTLATPPAATAKQLATMLPTYTFHPGMTFGGNDISNTGLTDNVPKLATWCDANASCKGFTTDAWMKSTIVPQDKWYKWSDDPTKGLYVKK